MIQTYTHGKGKSARRVLDLCALGRLVGAHKMGRGWRIPLGVHAVIEDDWIIQGIAGELYPCKPDIFEQTYEQVKEAGQ